jgi:hypothetical protein
LIDQKKNSTQPTAAFYRILAKIYEKTAYGFTPSDGMLFAFFWSSDQGN